MKKLAIIHFNDVYNIEPSKKEPLGGAARLAFKVKEYKSENPLVLFSGDCFSPSLMSSLTRGKQMPPILNALGVRASCLGNHDLDFGLEHFTGLANKCNFPWLAANIIDKQTGRRLGDLGDRIMFDWNGIKIGLLALVEHEWLTTLATIEPDEIEYRDFVEVGRTIADDLRQQGSELIIALTHMRIPNDLRLLNSVAEIDIVLGGHDHSYAIQLGDPHRNLLVKSGTDFQDLTRIDVSIDDEGNKEYRCHRFELTSEVEEDPEVKEIVKEYLDIMDSTLDQVLGYTAVELDGRFDSVRTSETNLGNFVCDVLRETAKSEICFINSGTLRSNRLHSRGMFTKKDMLDILPYIDETVILRLTGEELLASLENGVSQFPKMEGRFLQVSGVKFKFDPSCPPGERILRDSVYIVDRDATLDLNEKYSVCTKEFLAMGKDGFDVLKNAEVCLACEESPVLPTCIRYHFMKLDVLTKWKMSTMDLKCTWVNRFVANMKKSVGSFEDELPGVSRNAIFDQSFQFFAISPAVEGRIVQV